MNDSQQTAVQISDWAAQGDWRLLFLYRDRLEKVTPEDVQAVAKKYLTRNNRTVGLFIPSEKSERISIPPTPALAEMIGDYIAGPNHVLPTSRTARFASGLSVLDFMKRTSLISCDAKSLDAIAPAAEALAHLEGLDAHALSMEIRRR